MRNVRSFTGFTLIELLIVIAVLGVLAGVVLVALNPLEQLARGRDAGRKGSVAQLGHAMQAHYTSQNLIAYPLGSSAWQTNLVTSGEIQQVIQDSANSRGSCTTNNQGGFCYTTNGPNAIIWIILESRSDTTKAGGDCATAPESNFAAVAWIANQGKAGLTCLGTSVTTLPSYTAILN